jgi:hypothetical protein
MIHKELERLQIVIAIEHNCAFYFIDFLIIPSIMILKFIITIKRNLENLLCMFPFFTEFRVKELSFLYLFSGMESIYVTN